MAPTTTTTVEHAVLFRIRDGADPTQVDAWLSGLRSLSSLAVVVHLSAAPILLLHRHRHHQNSSSHFTHVLHCRYRTKSDLAAYAAHPSHLAVVRDLGAPICDDIMAVDWVSDDLHSAGGVALRLGSVVRLTLVRLPEGAGERDKDVIMAVLSSPPLKVDQISCGENFSPERARGFAVGSIWVFPDQDGLDKEAVRMVEEKVRRTAESVVVVDFVVESASPP